MANKVIIDEDDYAANSSARKISELLAQSAQNRSYNANETEQVEERNKRAAQYQANLANALLSILSTENGRAWINDLFVFCDVLGNPHVPGNPDHTSFNLGMQNVGTRILTKILEVSPEQYPTFLREAVRRDNQ